MLRDIAVDFPDEWFRVPPPSGALAVVFAPDDASRFRPNIVVTTSALPDPVDGVDRVEAYLTRTILEMDAGLVDFEVLDLWSVDDSGSRQRLIARHNDGDMTIEVVQQHTWGAEGVLVVTASVATDIVDALAAEIEACLDSVRVA
jgi:hypothetical protein